MNLRLLPLAALAFASFQAQADIVALWDYSATPTSTKHTQSANGASFATVGSIKTSFAAGVADQALSTDTYAAQNVGSATQGVQFNVDTSGYTDLVLTFAQRNSNTASAWTTLQYTVDGSNWISATNFQMPTAQSTKFVTGITFDFSSISEVDDNPLFGIRLLSIFAPGTNAYQQTAGASYGTAGTIRYDNVLFSGSAIPDTTPPVPEPESYALMLGGLAALSLLARRRLR